MLVWALYWAILAWVQVNILTDPDMIFGKLPSVKMPSWLAKITWGCEYCIAGQLCLWTFPFLFEYDFLEHLAFIGLGIFLVHLINYGIKKT